MVLGALEAGGTKMVCAVGNEYGEVIDLISIATDVPEKNMPQMMDFYKEYNIAALGIGCFGPIDLHKESKTYGYITSTPKLSWKNFPIVQTFQDALEVPVGFDTDVNAAALGEATFGVTQGLECSMYITIGTGIGAGIILNGRPLHGMIHPEAGHILLRRHQEDVHYAGTCARHCDCFEGLASGPSIEKRWGMKAASLEKRTDVWELEAYYIGQALCDYILTLSPQKIVLGGGVMKQEQLFPLIHQNVLHQLNGYLQSPELDQIESYIVPASLQDKQGVMGALTLALDAYNERSI